MAGTSPWFASKQRRLEQPTTPTPIAPGPDLELIAATPLSALRCVSYVDPERVAYCEPNQPMLACCLAGITRSAAAAAGVQVAVARSGWLTDQVWNWAAGAPVYCGGGGVLTQAWSSGWANAITVGHAINPKTLLVRIREPIGQVT